MIENTNKPSIKDRAVELCNELGNTVTEAARIINKEYYDGENSFDACRSRVRRAIGTHEVKSKDMKKKEESKKGSEAEPFVLSAWNKKTGRMMDIEEYCKHYNLAFDNIKDYKLVTHTGTPYWNIHWKSSAQEVIDTIDEALIEEVVQRYVKPVEFKKRRKESSERIIRAIYTDVHIAMCPNPEGKSLFGGVWNEKELMKRMRKMAKDIIYRAEKEDSSVLYVDELGDFMDGWKGKTVRQEHSIPQNMTTEEAFDLGVRFKIELADILVDSGQFSGIVFNNICNDNHAGTFGYIVNSAVKLILELKYPNMLIVNNFRKFINYYSVGNHCFILSHGKDDKHLKFGFKPILDDKQSVRIDQYMKDNNLYRQADFFEFSKGDSHQMILDYSTSDDFNYMNYPAFSPSSDWVQTNYKKGRSGYVVTAFSPDKEDIDVFPSTFKWKK